MSSTLETVALGDESYNLLVSRCFYHYIFFLSVLNNVFVLLSVDRILWLMVRKRSRLTMRSYMKRCSKHLVIWNFNNLISNMSCQTLSIVSPLISGSPVYRDLEGFGQCWICSFSESFAIGGN